MGRIVAMGETVMDILFHDKSGEGESSNFQPFVCVPGGSAFNSIISVGRYGMDCAFIGDSGDDRIGLQTVSFMKGNNVATDYLQLHKGLHSAISLAYLDRNGDAQYDFYKDPLPQDNARPLPLWTDTDALLLGSAYAFLPPTRQLVERVLADARKAGAMVYYDVNFRPTYSARRAELLPAILDNISMSTVVRASTEDLQTLYRTDDSKKIYASVIRQRCPLFICTAGAGRILVHTPQGIYKFATPHIPSDEIVSTVGAGDNFNAGFLCEMQKLRIKSADLSGLGQKEWQPLIETATRFASAVCRSNYNYILKN